MKVRLVLLLDDKLNNLSKELSKKISESFETYFSLGSTHIPHVTITTITFEDESELEEIVQQVKEFAPKITPMELELSGIGHDGLGYVSVHFRNDQWMTKLHEKANDIFGKKYIVKTEPFVPHLSLPSNYIFRN